MRCLIIGGDGMLGHRLFKAWRGRHDVKVTVRRELARYRQHELFTHSNCYDRIDVRELQRLTNILDEFQPQAVINAAGVVKQRNDCNDALTNLEVNAVFPHRLLRLCRSVGARLVHISTDCVFKGTRGNYMEHDVPDADDVYGMTKHLGELADPPAITLRSSMIGLELSHERGLVEWFLSQDGDVPGFTRAVFTGLTTSEMARVVEMILVEQPDLTGIWQVASLPITKYELLAGLAGLLKLSHINIIPDDGFICNRSLCGDAFANRTGYIAPSWQQMLAELAQEIGQRRDNSKAA